MNVSEYIVRYVEDLGIERAYCIVGGAQLWMCKALSKSTKLKFTFPNHEQAAVMAADGYARISGKPGVCFVTNGPALTNTVTGLAQAYVDSSPVVVFTGNSNSHHVVFEREHHVRQYGTQDVNTEKVVEPVTKKYYFLDDPAKTAEIVADAFHTAATGRPGPVVVEVPINIQGADCPCAYPPAEVKETGIPSLSDETVEAVLNKLINAKRPLVLAGQGVRLSDRVEEFRDMIHALQVPAVNSRMGIDTITTEDPLFVGRCGNHGDRASHFALETCDLLLVLGSRLAPNTTGYNVPAFSNQSYKILVECDKPELEKYGVKIDETIEGDLREFFDKTERILREKNLSAKHEHWAAVCQEWKKNWPIMQEKFYSKEQINSYMMVDAVTKQAKENDLILADTGSSCSVTAQVWNVREGQRVLISGGLSGMGYWATSMGLAQANKGNGQTIVFVGDGALQMNIQEFATVHLYNMPLKIFIPTNDGYQFVRMSQGGYNINPPFGTGIEDGVPIPDIEAVTKAYGISYVSVKDPSKLEETVKQVLEMEGPVVCEVFVSKDLNVEPRIRSIANPDGSFRMPAYENLYPYLDPEVLKKEMNKAFE